MSVILLPMDQLTRSFIKCLDLFAINHLDALISLNTENAHYAIKAILWDITHYALHAQSETARFV